MNIILKFKLDDWSVLKNIFANINEIIDEVAIECTDENLKFRGIDRSHICFFEGKISSGLFDEYLLEKPLYLYIDLVEFVKVLKRGKNKEVMVFEADNEVIKINFKDKNNRIFSITQIDMEENMRNLPELDYSTDFECDFDSIKNSLVDADLYSEVLMITCEDDLLTLSCESGFGSYKNECPLDENVNGSYSSNYSIKWLSKIFNNKLSSDNFRIHMGDDYPMLIEFKSDNIQIDYLLAPRLEQT